MYCRADLSRTITLVVALLAAVAATSAFAREFRAADTRNEDYPTVQALLYMGSMVAERSGGRHQIKVFHSRQLGEEKETLEQTRVGAIDLNRTNVALIGNTVPAMNVLAMPAWGSLSAEDQQIFRESALRSSRFMREKWRDLEERSRKQAEAAGVEIVTDIDRKPFEAAMAGLYAKAQHDPAVALLIERIREVQ